MAGNEPLEPGECPETIQDVYIGIRAHFAKIEKNRHFRFKKSIKKFSKSIFAGRLIPDNKSILLEETSHRAPQAPIKWAPPLAPYHISPLPQISLSDL